MSRDIYMVFYSIGSASGAIASTGVYAVAGWLSVCALGASLGVIALLFWAATLRPARSARRRFSSTALPRPVTSELES